MDRSYYFASSLLSGVNSLTTEKQMTKFSSEYFQKVLSSIYTPLRIQRLKGHTVDLDEDWLMMSYALSSLQTQLFSSLVLKELRNELVAQVKKDLKVVSFYIMVKRHEYVFYLSKLLGLSNHLSF